MVYKRILIWSVQKLSRNLKCPLVEGHNTWNDLALKAFRVKITQKLKLLNCIIDYQI